MKAIILAAGYATRLYPLTENYPKPLLMVGDKPILNWLIEDLTQIIDEFIVVTNHKYFGIFREWAGKGIQIIDDGTCTIDTRLGAVRDIQLAAKNIDSDVLVMAGDNMLDFSLVPFVKYGQMIGTSCVMYYEETNLVKLQKTAVITTNSENIITSYEEKPILPKSNCAVPPFYYFRLEDLNKIEEALQDGCGYDAPGSFAAWLSGRTTMHAWKMPGRRFDIGDFESYVATQAYFRQNASI